MDFNIARKLKGIIMSTQKRLSITDFLSEEPAKYCNFTSQAHELLTQNGYKAKFQIKKHGLSAQYNSPKTKGNALQLIIHGDMLQMYLYNIFFYEFNGFLEKLPLKIIEDYDEYRV